MKHKQAKLQLATRISPETNAQLAELIYAYEDVGQPRSIQQIVESALMRWCRSEQRRLARKTGRNGINC